MKGFKAGRPFHKHAGSKEVEKKGSKERRMQGGGKDGMKVGRREKRKQASKEGINKE